VFDSNFVVSGFKVTNEKDVAGTSETFIASFQTESKQIVIDSIDFDYHGRAYYSEQSSELYASNIYYNTTRTTGGFVMHVSCEQGDHVTGEVFLHNITFESHARDEFMLKSLIDYAGPFNITIQEIKFLSFMRS